MLNIYLLRHGETHWNADGNRYCGRTDIGLTAKGIFQAEAAAHHLKNLFFEGIYSSPLKRAVDTAKIVSSTSDVITDKRLIEADFGNWEGKTKEEFIKADPSSWDDWCRNPDSTKAGLTGETALDVVIRVNNFFEEALEKHSSGAILVVAHNGVNRLYLAWKLGMELKNYRRIVQENSSITLFGLDHITKEITLKLLNGHPKEGGI